MDFYRELDLYLTRLHPNLKLGNASLKGVKDSDFFNKKLRKSSKALIDYNEKNQNAGRSENKSAKPNKDLISRANKKPEIIPCKRPREILCPICEWQFPHKFTEEDMTEHIELCMEGKGADHISQYQSQLKQPKSVQKKSQKSLIKLAIPSTCPDCNLTLSTRPLEFSTIHLASCKGEQVHFLQNLLKTPYQSFPNKLFGTNLNKPI